MLNLLNRLKTKIKIKTNVCVLCQEYAENGAEICSGCLKTAIEPLYIREQTVCATCVAPLEQTDVRICENCRKKPLPFRQAWASVAFEPPISELILDWKQKKQIQYSSVLAWIMAQNVPIWLENARNPQTQPQTQLELVAMPISLKKRIERGFNQSDELVERLGKRLGLNVLGSEMIFRIHKSAQKNLNRAQRLHNIRDSFEIVGDVRDKRLVLVDDVLTSGASLGELARALHEAGALEVWVWILARTQPKKGD